MGDEFPKTLSVPEAGMKYFGLSPNSSYAAAARGDLKALERMLENAGTETPAR